MGGEAGKGEAMESDVGDNFRFRFSKGSQRSQGRNCYFGRVAHMMILLQFPITI